ncbi:hypothetical protein ANCCEY_08901 [Ancylostoma ceylanicum]|uniref:DNA helicase Pif1-like 2B domain-containing protein n=1 Tax=Ancylostoma ceylanicum TaxID=53326 RepID=A0A0D6LJ41_9BILA|nr:hypothetical protein ANCCEY_08901 [Ancylostoma ceylanicum]
MRFIYRSMTCSKDKELFKEYCLKAVKKKQAFWDDEKVIQWIMTGALSPNAHSTIPGDENLLHELLNDEKQLTHVALLSIRNTDVLSVNDLVVEKLSGEYMNVHGVDEAVQEEDGIDGLLFDDEEDIHKETYPLRLKKGCISMLLRNIDITSQLCNGTHLQLYDVVHDEKHVPIILRCRNLIMGSMRLIPCTPNVYENKVSGIAFKRFQFPVRLAFCMTVNKSHGQNSEKVGLTLRTPAFAHGTIYVALSRSTCREDTKITANENCQKLSGGDILLIRDVVYKEVL